MSSYYFTEEHDMFRQSLRAFLEKEVKPNIEKWEEERELPREIYGKFGEMGYFGLMQPEAYGGMDLDFWFTVILNEEIARMNSGGFGASIGAHPYLALTHLNAEGNEAQKQKYLVPGIRGETIGCLAITEPFGGSDVQAIRTTAIRVGDHFMVNGSKTFITNGVSSDFIVAAVKTDPEAAAKGISMIIIDRDLPGVSATPLKKLGWHASDTGEIAFDNVKVPADNLLGEENQGFFYIMQHFVLERLTMAIGGMASSEYSLELTLKYMGERTAFGRTLNKFQELRHRIAQMASEIEMNKQFIYHLCERFQNGDYLVKEASMAKLLATQLADKVATECLQMFGGYGYMEEYPMARFFRDARLGQIGGGTSEILKEIISKTVIDGQGYAPSVKAAGSPEKNAAVFHEVHDLIRARVEPMAPVGNILKFDFGDRNLCVDGTGDQNVISMGELPADCTLKLSASDLKELLQGSLNPMSAVTSGRITISGDMAVAAKMQLLFS